MTSVCVYEIRNFYLLEPENGKAKFMENLKANISGFQRVTNLICECATFSKRNPCRNSVDGKNTKNHEVIN